MRSAILAVASGLLAASPCFAQTSDFHIDPDGLIHAGGVEYQNWTDYVQSDYFKEHGLRCGAQIIAGDDLRGSPTDCSYNNTNPSGDYDPSVARYRIPVVVHVIESTSGEGHLSESQVQSQIDILNEDYLALPGTNGQNSTDAEIEFYLATEDPGGNPTNGITYSVNNTWFNDSGTYYNSLAWDTSRYLNIYTNSASGALGYVPDLPQGGIAGNNADRVVILYSAFGRNSPLSPYNQGRTATHEVGHYLGLYHTFESCGSASSCYTSGDRICDTNPQSSPNYNCFSGGTCGYTDDFRNFMDYTADLCMNHFTNEQVHRMRCSLEFYRSLLYDIGSPCGGDGECDDGDPCNGTEWCDNGICRPGTITDCNANEIDDACDIASGFSQDCDGNGIPDSCDIADGTFADCNGNGVPDVCDIASGFSQDCNGNGIPDSCDLSPTSFSVTSSTLSPIGFSDPQNYVVAGAPDAAGDVTLDFFAIGDFDATSERITVFVGGTNLGFIFEVANACPQAEDTDQVVVPPATWNTAITSGGGDVTIQMSPSSQVNSTECFSGTHIRVSVSYPATPASADDNTNGIPDECEGLACSPADITTQGAGVGDPGYGEPDGAVTAADLNYFVNAYLATDLAIADVTTQGAGVGDPGYGVPDGSVTAADLNFYVNDWVIGCP